MMKALTKKDLPILVKFIKRVTHGKVVINNTRLWVWKNHKMVADMMLIKGTLYSTNKINGFTMVPSGNTAGVWPFKVIIGG